MRADPPVPAALDAQVEALAEYAHMAWTGWMKYLFSNCIHGGPALQIPPDWEARWMRQINTPYADLSEREKESDRVEARKMLAALRAAGPRRTTLANVPDLKHIENLLEGGAISRSRVDGTLWCTDCHQLVCQLCGNCSCDAYYCEHQKSKEATMIPDTPDEIEHFWTAVERGWDIEPRAYFEKEAVAMGFKSPVEMAVHWMWKRHAKTSQVLDAETEKILRLYLWLSHGHQGVYGDDGEMQCSQCAPVYDYKRSPLATIIRQAIKARRDVNIGILIATSGSPVPPVAEGAD